MFHQLLAAMLEDVHKAPALFQPTQFWRAGIPPILTDLEQKGLETFRSHPSALSMYVPTYMDQGYRANRLAFDGLLAKLGENNPDLANLWHAKLSGFTDAERDYQLFLAADHPGAPELQSFAEDGFGMPLEQFQFEGRNYGCCLLRYLKCLAFLKKTVATDHIESVLEIGGGFGSLGEILLKSQSKDYFYLDVDIPPLAAVATAYLQAVFGAEKVADYGQTRQQSSIDIDQLKAQGYRAAVICPWQLPALKGRFQLFVNTSSFQEMEPEVVSNYAHHISQLLDGHMLLRNSRHGKVIAKHDGDIGVHQQTRQEDYLTIFNDYQLLAKDAVLFGHTTPGGFSSEVLIFASPKS